MPRTWLFGALGALLAAALSAPGCAPETFTFEGAASSSSGSGGGGGSTACEPGSMAPCYSGPANTRSVGICKDGMATCAPDGSGFGDCVGQILPAFDDCATVDDEDCNGTAAPCSGGHLWSEAGGDDSQQRGWGIATDADGNSVVVGEYYGSLFPNLPPSMGLGDIFAVKIDPGGQPIWARAWGDSMAQIANAVAIDKATGDAFIAGNFLGSVNFGNGTLDSAGGRDIFVLRISAAGEVMWSKRFGDLGTDDALDIAVGGGHVAITGVSTGDLNFGAGDLIMNAGQNDGFVAVLDAATGAGIWDKGFGDPGSQQGSRVRIAADGSVVMTGFGESTVDFGNGPRTSAGNNDAYLVKFGSAGGVVWSKLLGGAADERGSALALDANDNVILGGTMTGMTDFGGGPLFPVGGTDMFLVKYDKSGAHLWSHNYGSEAAAPNAVATDGAGNVVAVGDMTGNIDFGSGALPGHADTDGFIAKLNGGGSAIWAINFGTGGGNERGNDVAVDGLGNEILTGSFDNSVVFVGAGALTSMGANDVFVAKLAP